MLDKIYEICRKRMNEVYEKEFVRRNPIVKRPGFWETVEQDQEHDYMYAFYDIGVDEEASMLANEFSKYIKNKESGYTLLIKDLRKQGSHVSRNGKVVLY